MVIYPALAQLAGHGYTMRPLYQAGLLMAMSESQLKLKEERTNDLEHIYPQRLRVFLSSGLAGLRIFIRSF